MKQKRKSSRQNGCVSRSSSRRRLALDGGDAVVEQRALVGVVNEGEGGVGVDVVVREEVDVVVGVGDQRERVVVHLDVHRGSVVDHQFGVVLDGDGNRVRVVGVRDEDLVPIAVVGARGEGVEGGGGGDGDDERVEVLVVVEVVVVFDVVAAAEGANGRSTHQTV